MTRRLTIAMYHYVRDLAGSRYPEIKGLTVDLFKEQISYIKKHYCVISGEDLLNAVESEAALPPNALLLTFDDGYVDHFSQVLPILEAHNLPACFFPPVRCVLNNEVLDVNKIHFVLASVSDKQLLVKYIYQALAIHREQYELAKDEHYWETIAKPSRFDPAEVIFVKRMLQRELPEELRNKIAGELFREYVTRDEQSFSRDLYMSMDQLKSLHQQGMYIGSHGYGHYWMGNLERAAQVREIDRSLDFLTQIGTDTRRWIMCYPQGSYNDSLLSVLSERHCKVGLTTNIGIADLSVDQPLILPRLDTNDLPKDANAAPGQWTLKATGTAD
jgi:peptidoglycan/xylan/chitin deacetylase (PgdA/CDA1 family)